MTLHDHVSLIVLSSNTSMNNKRAVATLLLMLRQQSSKTKHKCVVSKIETIGTFNDANFKRVAATLTIHSAFRGSI